MELMAGLLLIYFLGSCGFHLYPTSTFMGLKGFLVVDLHNGLSGGGITV
jgi:hypothetical protein